MNVRQRYSGQGSRRLGLPFLVALLTLSAALGGCATNSYPDTYQSDVNSFQGGVSAGPQLSAFLDQAQPGSTTAISNSPLGSNATVNVEERYFSASGFNCLRMNVESAQGNSRYSHSIACKVGNRTASSNKGSTAFNWMLQSSIISQIQPDYTGSTDLTY